MDWPILRCRRWCGIALVAAVLAFTGPGAFAATEVGIYAEKSFIEKSEPVQQISVAARSDEQVIVDVHIGLIAPDQTIYEYPNWNTSLTPWLSSFTLPAGFEFSATEIFNAAQLPGDLVPGVWYAAIALTEPGTLNFVAVALAPFRVVDEASNDGTVYGSVSLSRLQSNVGVNVEAGGVFVDVDGTLDDLKDAYLGNPPDIDQCVLYEIPIDISAIPDLDVNTQDAGSSLRVVKPGTVLQVPKDSDSASQGFEVYSASASTDFYQGNVVYRFEGNGGMDIGGFATSVKAPPPLTLSQPPVTGVYSHNASTPLQLMWDATAGLGEVNVSLVGSTLSTVVTIDCRFADDGKGIIPANLISQMKSILDQSSSDSPFGDLGDLGDFGDLELPPGFELPILPTQVTLSAARIAFTLFNTVAGDLNVGIASIQSGASVSVDLQ